MTSEDSLREELDALEGSEREIEDMAPVRAKMSKERRSVVPIRLSPSELLEISEAAGGNVSAFIRDAAMRRARSLNDKKAETISSLRAIYIAHFSGSIRREMSDKEVVELTTELLASIAHRSMSPTLEQAIDSLSGEMTPTMAS